MYTRYLLFALALLAVLPGHASAYYGGDLDVTMEASQFCPCDIISSNEIVLELTNYGTKPDTFYLSMEIPDGWGGFVLPEITLASGESQVIDPAWISPPCGTEPGKYVVRFSAESAMSGKVSQEDVEIDLLECHAVDVDFDYFSVCEGGEKTETVTISNPGNFEDTFMVSVSPDWVRATPGKVVIGEQDSSTVTLTATPPAGTSGRQNVTVEALSLNTYASSEKTVEIEVDRCHDFTASIVPPEKEVCFGEDASYTLTIDNRGKGTDTYGIAAPSWVDVSKENVTVRAGERATVALKASPLSPGQKRMAVYVSSLKYATAIMSLESLVTARDCRDASVSVTPEVRSVCETEGTSFTIAVNNTGNILTAYDLYITFDGVTSLEELLLEPHEVQELQLDTEPLDKTGRYPLRAKAYVGNRSVGSAEAEVVASRCYDAAIELPEITEAVCVGDVIEYGVLVENLGEREDDYTLSYSGGSEDFSLASRESRTVIVDIPVDYPWGSTNALPFTLVSENGVRKSAETVLDVSDKQTCYSAEIVAETADGVDAVKGFGVPVALRVKNEGIRPDTYALGLGAPEWVHISADEVTVGEESDETVYLYISPDYETAEEDYTITVVAESGNSFARTEINASVLRELVENRTATGMGGTTGMFLIGAGLTLQVAVVSMLAVLTGLLVYMRFFLFR